MSVWKIKLPTGEWLDTPQSFSLQFELNNQVFSRGDTTALAGSFSFPVQIPLTPLANRQLGFPGMIDNSRKFTDIEGVWVYVDGTPMFYGTLQIKKSNRRSVSIAIIANPLLDLKTKNLNELDLGTVTVAPDTWPDHMKDTALNPEDYDHAFFPVKVQEELFGWNIWFNTTETFPLTDETHKATPFLRVKSVLQIMFNSSDGWTFQNKWQGSNVELGRLYLFNNIDARIQVTEVPSTLALPDEFELNKFAPAITCADLLKRISAQWCLGVFTNIFQRTITLRSLSDVLSAQVKQDWTNYATSEPEIETPDSSPGYYNYPQLDSIPAEIGALENATIINTSKEYYDLVTPAPGFYYVENSSALVEIPATGAHRSVGNFHMGVRPGVGEDYESNMEALFDSIESHKSRSGFTGYHEVEGSSPLEHEWEVSDYPIALMFYRGIQQFYELTGKDPVNGNNVWLDGNLASPGDRVKISTNGVDGPDASRSLNWFGEFGLYETAHKQWQTILMEGKHCSQQFILPITTLTSFSFEDKIRVGNMDFIAKRLRIQSLIGNGQVQVEASLISVI
jgi:hypothetical protein